MSDGNCGSSHCLLDLISQFIILAILVIMFDAVVVLIVGAIVMSSDSSYNIKVVFIGMHNKTDFL